MTKALFLAGAVAAVLLVVAAGWTMAGSPGAPAWMPMEVRTWGGMMDGCDGCPHHGGGGGASAAGADVVIRNTEFAPKSLRVAVGETVTWTNLDGLQHTVTSDEGLFDSGLLGEGDSWSWTFDAPGTYTYHCTPHAWERSDGSWMGQVGVVIVE